MQNNTEDNVTIDKSHWSYNLINSMNNSNEKLEEDEKIVVLKDKYPKAQYHYLILPKKNIPAIKNVTKDDLNLLYYMEMIAKKYVIHNNKFKYLIGYHSIPSLHPLHLHVISTDFVSHSLKTIKHWNSFTTPYFLQSEDVRKELEENGEIKIDTKIYVEYLKTKLKCYHCSYYPKTMPDLKRHLLKHL